MHAVVVVVVIYLSITNTKKRVNNVCAPAHPAQINRFDMASFYENRIRGLVYGPA